MAQHAAPTSTVFSTYLIRQFKSPGRCCDSHVARSKIELADMENSATQYLPGKLSKSNTRSTWLCHDKKGVRGICQESLH